MERYLITPSLHDAWLWYIKLDDKTDAEFLATLRKEPFAPSEAMQKGIAFEDAVLAYTKEGGFPDDASPEYIDCIRQIGDIVAGGLWQERAGKDVILDGVHYILYGKADVVKRNWLYDIKYTTNYEIGKYLMKIQHPVYMSLFCLQNFGYLITDGRNFYREDYFWQADSEVKMLGELQEMMAFIYSVPEFKAAYLEHWKAR